jgi:hypothetical protein
MHPTPEALDVATFRPEDIPWSGIAFNTTSWALRDWLKLMRPDLVSARNHDPEGGIP